MCRLGRVSRAGYYRWLVEAAPAQTDIALRHCIQLLALANKHYGYRRITVELRRQGYVVNTKRVLRLMREDNLLVLRRKSFVPQTTDSGHVFPIALNLIRELVPTGLDQIWVTDITYVRLQQVFIYLAVVLDAFSRKVVGWALEDHLRAELAIAALDMALAARKPRPNSLIHHSDRGEDVVATLERACRSVGYPRTIRVDQGSEFISRDLDLWAYQRGVELDFSRPGKPTDNAFIESFNGKFRSECLNAHWFLTLDDARLKMEEWRKDYNTVRPHSAIGNKPPISLTKGSSAASAL